MNKAGYVNKMEAILADSTKFQKKILIMIPS